MVMVNTETSMLLGGTSEPAYHLTITALELEIAPTMNKRSTYLIQDFIHDTLHIPPKRGVLRFEAVAEENLATNGMTALQEIEHLERQPTEGDGFIRALSRQRSRRSKKSSLPVVTEGIQPGIASTRTATPSNQYYPSVDTKSTVATGFGKKRIKTRKSILAIFKR
jgi:hypothetical protein